MVKRLCALGGALFLSAYAITPVEAQEFYRGKTVNLMVNYTTGGPTDTEARLLARHLGKHLPGEPVIVVRNMAGAGGMIGANWLGQAAPRDGLTFGYLTGVAAAAAQGTESLKIDATKLPFVAGFESLGVYYARKDLGGGLAQTSDLMSKQDFWVGGLTPDTSKDIALRAELELLGLKHKYISGYPGAAEVRLALEHNEVQMTSESLPTFRALIQPGLIEKGSAITLWYDAPEKYSRNGHPEGEELRVMTFEQVYRKHKGEPPTQTLLWRMNRLVTEFTTSLLRTVQLPPGVPPEVMPMMRKAIESLSNDPEYRADAMKTLKYVPRFATGGEAEKAYLNSVNVDPLLRQFMRAYVEQGYVLNGKK